jgi:hypothetical protein
VIRRSACSAVATLCDISRFSAIPGLGSIFQLAGSFRYNFFYDNQGFQAQHIYGTNSLGQPGIAQDLIGYSTGYAVGESLKHPVDHGEINVGVHNEPSWWNKAICALTIYAATWWYLGAEYTRLTAKILAWALVGVALASAISNAYAAFVEAALSLAAE